TFNNGVIPYWGGTETTALAVSYTFGDWTVAAAFQNGEIGAASNDKTVLTATGNIGDFTLNLAAADNEGTRKYAIGGSFTTGATTINAYVANEDTAGIDTTYGLGVSHDLGGAKLIGGVTSDEFGLTHADFGIKFTF
ncbi:MAG: porin, partial [Paracoccaceae bacterium]